MFLFLSLLFVGAVCTSGPNRCLRKSYVRACALRCAARSEADACIDKCVIRMEKDAGCLAPTAAAATAVSTKKPASRRRRHRRRHSRRRAVVSKKAIRAARCKRLRRRLARWTNKAAKCGDVNTACVDRAYKRVAALKRRLVKNRCVKSVCDVKDLRVQRKRLQRASSKCADDDSACVRINIRALRKVNRKIRRCKARKNNVRVKIVKVFVVKKKKLTPVRKCKGWVHQSMYRNAVTCDALNKKFMAWLAFARCRRQRNFELSHRCRSSDTGCLRRSFRMIRKIQRQIDDAHAEFGTLIERCDRCAGIKIDFRKWLLRERAKRHRAHVRACLCGPLDIECLQDNVSRIKTIQTRIEARRKQVLSLHSDCVLQKGTTDAIAAAPATTTTTTAVATTAAPGVASSTTQTTTVAASASASTPQKVQFVQTSNVNDIPGPGQILVIKRN